MKSRGSEGEDGGVAVEGEGEEDLLSWLSLRDLDLDEVVWKVRRRWREEGGWDGAVRLICGRRGGAWGRGWMRGWERESRLVRVVKVF